MTIEDVVKLIEACKNAGVAKLKFEKLELGFHTPDPNAMAVSPLKISREVEQELEADEDLTDLELQNLMINDPMAYETYVRKSGNVKESGRA